MPAKQKKSSYWKFIEVTHSLKSSRIRGSAVIIILLKLFFFKIAARWRYRLPSNNLTAHYNSQFCVSFYFFFWPGSPNMPLNMSELGLNIIYFIYNLYVGAVLYIAGLVSNPRMLEKDCNGNPISTFPPCYAFQIIFTAFAPRLIQSISCNVHNMIRALKQLWEMWQQI